MIRLENQVICVSGEVDMYRPSHDRLFAERGVRLVDELDDDVTLLALGTHWSTRHEARARALGIPIVEGLGLRALLRDGYLIEDHERGRQTSLDASISELRGRLAGAPSFASWEAIVCALDGCVPERQSELVRYVTRELMTWGRDDHRASWAATTQADRYDGARYVGGEWCTAPLHWVDEIVHIGPQPKHRLIRGLSFEGPRLERADARRLLTNRELDGSLRALDLGLDQRLDYMFYEALAASENLGAVETLIAYPQTHHSGETLAAQTSMPGLRRFHMRGTRNTHSNEVRALCEAPWFDQIEVFESSMTEGRDWYGGLSPFAILAQRPNALPSLKHLILGDQIDSRTFGRLDAFDRIERLTYRPRRPVYFDAGLEYLSRVDTRALRVLDVSQVFEAPRLDPLADWAEAMIRARPDVERMASRGLERLILGPHAPQRVWDAFPADLTGRVGAGL